MQKGQSRQYLDSKNNIAWFRISTPSILTQVTILQSFDEGRSSTSFDRDSQSAAIDENLLELTNRLRQQQHSRSGSEELVGATTDQATSQVCRVSASTVNSRCVVPY